MLYNLRLWMLESKESTGLLHPNRSNARIREISFKFIKYFDLSNAIKIFFTIQDQHPKINDLSKLNNLFYFEHQISNYEQSLYSVIQTLLTKFDSLVDVNIQHRVKRGIIYGSILNPLQGI